MADVCAVGGDHPISGSQPVVTLSHVVKMDGMNIHVSYGLCDEHRHLADGTYLPPGKYYGTFHVMEETE